LDALGGKTAIRYEKFSLFPAGVTDAAGLTTSAEYDPRLLTPTSVTDPNGNRTFYDFTPLGLMKNTAMMGATTETAGDTLALPSLRLSYDFHAFDKRGEPISATSTRRVHHAQDVAVAAADLHETIASVEYSDGFGRLLQKRAQAEDVLFGDRVFGGFARGGPTSAQIVGRERPATDPVNVIVSGWQIYNNKGWVVAKYEPCFTSGYSYSEPTNAERGRKVEMLYDPRGHLVVTRNPDGSEQVVVHGIPGTAAGLDLSDPSVFVPSPWETFTYDPNDNAGRTHSLASTKFSHHWNTPSSIVVDALGRTVLSIERNGSNPSQDWYTTAFEYDIRGNVTQVIDPLGRHAFKHVYDLGNQTLRTTNIDAGVRRHVFNAAGLPVEQRDSKGSIVLYGYDVLNRPVKMWASNMPGQAVTLREQWIYGDDAASGMSWASAARWKLLGRIYRHYDEAGVLNVEQYDFKGNIVEKSRQMIGDAAILRAITPSPSGSPVTPFAADWEAAAALSQMETSSYHTSTAFDALNRVRVIRSPQDVEGKRRELRPQYNRGGSLERVLLDRDPYVEHIAYDAKGQRSLIAYGNGAMTIYGHDPDTFRLTCLKTESFTRTAAWTFRRDGVIYQDFAYNYDLVGNILQLKDSAPKSGIPGSTLGTDALNRDFEYEPTYRLSSANGRECDLPADEPWKDTPRCTDLTKARGYSERYEYDRAGNLLSLNHQAVSGSFVRDLELAPGNNQLRKVSIGSVDIAYEYDANGNMTREFSSRHFTWDHSDRLEAFRTQAPGATEPTLFAQYLYDSGGQRIKKLVRKGAVVEVTHYVDGIFEHCRITKPAGVEENDSVHVMDAQSRVALVRIGTPFSGDSTTAVKYHLGDHLGSSNVVLDDMGSLVNREEYTPYGETSFGSFERKRYRFSGKERDEESGLLVFTFRYYLAGAGRWVGCDPIGMHEGVNPYVYVEGNPVTFIDKMGLASESFQEAPSSGVSASGLPSKAPTAATDAPPVSRLEKAQRQFAENRMSGKEAEADMGSRYASKGHEVNHQVTVGKSRFDMITSKAKVSTEVKSLDVSKSTYSHPNKPGEPPTLKLDAIKHRVGQMIPQLKQHIKDLQADGRLPSREILVVRVKGAAEAFEKEVSVAVRAATRDVLKSAGLKGGVIVARSARIAGRIGGIVGGVSQFLLLRDVVKQFEWIRDRDSMPAGAEHTDMLGNKYYKSHSGNWLNASIPSI
jgi:RHS repeat-associated protein